MNKIIKEHYPAARLPADLREGLDPAQEVTVTVEVGAAGERVGSSRKSMTLEEIFAKRRPPYRSLDEIVHSIRRQRDNE